VACIGKSKIPHWERGNSGNKEYESMTWRVIDSHDPEGVIPEMEHASYGLKCFKPYDYKKSEVMYAYYFCSSYLKIGNAKYQS
jgi:hypothetical protein